MLSSILYTIFQVTSKPSTSKLTKVLISAKESLDFRIIIELSSYRSIGLSSNRIYDLFFIEQSYKDQRKNVSNIVLSFNLSVISCIVSIVNPPIYQTKLLFFLHLICLYINAWTIVQPKYDIIIYMIYLLSSDQPFITIKK